METTLASVLILIAFLVASWTVFVLVLLSFMFYKPKQREDAMFNKLSAENQAKYLYWLIMHENDD